MAYTYNPTRAQYRDSKTGKFIKAADVVALSKESAKASGSVVGTYARQVANAEIGTKEFNTLMRDEVKAEAITQYLAGRGGLEQMTQKDWGTVGAHVRDQYKYLTGFIDAVKTGDMSEGAIAARATLYMAAARAMYGDGRANAIVASGEFTEETWVLGRKEHCDDCLTYAGEGWQPIGTFPTPGDGSTECHVNCGCTKDYR